MFEKLIDKLKEIPPKILAWWNKFTKNQKMLIISVAIGVAIAFGVLIFAVTRTQYVTLITCETTKQAGEVKSILESNEIQYKISDSGLVISVDKSRLSALPKPDAASVRRLGGLPPLSSRPFAGARRAGSGRTGRHDLP